MTKKALALVPGTSNQTAKHSDDGNVVDNDCKVRAMFLSFSKVKTF